MTRSPASSAASARVAHRLVGLAEVLPPLGVPDDRARDAELGSIGAETSPVNAPSSSQWTFCAYDRDAAVRAQPLQRRLERDVRRAHDDVDARRVRRDAPNPRSELARLVGALEHLPVPGNEHR